MNDIMLSEIFDTNLGGEMLSPENYSSFFESLNDEFSNQFMVNSQNDMSSLSGFLKEADDNEAEIFEVSSKKSKKHKRASNNATSSDEVNVDGQNKVSHITVERNRRKQMNEHLSVLRSLMPCFYVKRGDQASIIGGVVDYINELQQVLQSLESKKQRKIVYNEVLSPRLIASPKLSPPSLSPNKPPSSPRLFNLPISPKTPLQPVSPYKSPRGHQILGIDNNAYNSNEHFVVANSKSSIADVEVKFSGPNLVLKTVSKKRHGQVLKIISRLQELSLEVLNVKISNIDETMINSFTIKIGIECQLSAEELAYQIHQTFW